MDTGTGTRTGATSTATGTSSTCTSTSQMLPVSLTNMYTGSSFPGHLAVLQASILDTNRAQRNLTLRQ